MWHIEINEWELKQNKLCLTVCVKESLFSKFLINRREFYPIYLKCNKNWFTPHNPYQPYLTPFPEVGGLKVRINEPMTLILPSNFVKFFKNKYEENIVINLLKWLDEEYKLFQDDWIDKAVPDYST